jgi:hypothetical protein
VFDVAFAALSASTTLGPSNRAFEKLPSSSRYTLSRWAVGLLPLLLLLLTLLLLLLLLPEWGSQSL